MNELYVTDHAADRWMERVDPTSPGRNTTRARIKRCHATAIQLPNRHAKRWVKKFVASKATRARKLGLRFRFHPSAVFICKNSSVVTVIDTTLDDLATVLTWMLLGVWVEESPA